MRRGCRNYAEEVFGEPFDADAIVTESVLQPEAFFGDTPVDPNLDIPGPAYLADLDAENFADVQTCLGRQAALWLAMERSDVASDAWRIELGRRLLSHVCFRHLIVLLSRRLYTMEELVTELKKLSPVFEADDRHYPYVLLSSLLALISSALTPAPDGGRPQPFLQIRLQL